MRIRCSQNLEAGAVPARQRIDIHFAQVEAVADRDSVTVGNQVRGEMLAHQSDQSVAVHRNMRVGDLGIDNVVYATLLGADALVEESPGKLQIIVFAILETIFA